MACFTSVSAAASTTLTLQATAGCPRRMTVSVGPSTGIATPRILESRTRSLFALVLRAGRSGIEPLMSSISRARVQATYRTRALSSESACASASENCVNHAEAFRDSPSSPGGVRTAIANPVPRRALRTLRVSFLLRAASPGTTTIGNSSPLEA